MPKAMHLSRAWFMSADKSMFVFKVADTANRVNELSRRIFEGLIFAKRLYRER